MEHMADQELQAERERALDDLKRSAGVAERLEKALTGDSLFRLLLIHLEQKKREGLNALAEADPADMTAICKHQTTVRAANMAAGWVEETIQVGRKAIDAFLQTEGYTEAVD